ncbi:DOPA 4,5-dioxygenase family protein [uncultured Brevundimonas sp.]|uniref:DOPA 4,5-dioxygenase family protein n=1 Tax=uncultured Brevundimonas sp. TaxID=213418 RepID=UPI0026180AAC|nr:DOPA 4,5-dioxygenase family protein [uncultured Brevundimonas sp.]
MTIKDTARPAGDDQWAELVSPGRRNLLLGVGAATAAVATAAPKGAEAGVKHLAPAGAYDPFVPPPAQGTSPWGDTINEATPAPVSLRPGEQTLPEKPQPFTRITSYHAHVYFDEDNHHKAERLRQWVIERFHVELGNWNLGPRGPHVTPSFYFGFTNDLLPIIVPWLQLNSLGLTILLHPNTDDPRADHLDYAMWINRTQPVNAYRMASHVEPHEVEKILPNTRPTIVPERG